MNHCTFKKVPRSTLLTCLLVSALACSDDSATPAETGEGADGETEAGETSTNTGTGTGETEAGETEAGETEAGETEGGETEGGETEGGETDTDGPAECEPEMPDPGWTWSIVDGEFDDIPSDVDESCLVSASPDPIVMALDCPFAQFELSFDVSPAVPLPEPGAMVQLRLHHEPGWLNWPNFWIDVEVVDGDHYSLIASSTLEPSMGAYAVPWSPSLGESDCGPFITTDPIGGEDPCGEQMAAQLGFDVDGETVLAWHGTHVATEVDGRAFEAWTSSAREYLAPPQTCDISPTWYSLVSRRAAAG